MARRFGGRRLGSSETHLRQGVLNDLPVRTLLGVPLMVPSSTSFAATSSGGMDDLVKTTLPTAIGVRLKARTRAMLTIKLLLTITAGDSTGCHAITRTDGSGADGGLSECQIKERKQRLEWTKVVISHVFARSGASCPVHAGQRTARDTCEAGRYRRPPDSRPSLICQDRSRGAPVAVWLIAPG